MHALLSWPAYLPDISSTENVWDLVGQRLPRDPRPSASKHELWQRIQATWNSLQQTFKICNDFLPRHIAAYIAAHGGCTKY